MRTFLACNFVFEFLFHQQFLIWIPYFPLYAANTSDAFASNTHTHYSNYCCCSVAVKHKQKKHTCIERVASDDCQVTPYDTWGECTGACGGTGKKYRHRYYKNADRASKCHRKLFETKSCTMPPCKNDGNVLITYHLHWMLICTHFPYLFGFLLCLFILFLFRTLCIALSLWKPHLSVSLSFPFCLSPFLSFSPSRNLLRFNVPLHSAYDHTVIAKSKFKSKQFFPSICLFNFSRYRYILFRTVKINRVHCRQRRHADWYRAR